MTKKEKIIITISAAVFGFIIIGLTVFAVKPQKGKGKYYSDH
jgi:hypothetical protein